MSSLVFASSRWTVRPPRGASTCDAHASRAKRPAEGVRDTFGVRLISGDFGTSFGSSRVRRSRSGDTVCVAYRPDTLQQRTTRRDIPTSSPHRGGSCVVHVQPNGDGNADANAVKTSSIQSAITFAKANYFLLGMCLMVFTAYLNPGFGANGGPLKPEVTISKLAVRVMFLISGLSLPINELKAAVTNVKANLLIQFFIFVFLGLVVTYVLAPIVLSLGVLSPELIKGLIILSCLPTTIGTGVALTNASNGNVAVAIFHAVFSNIVGIVLAPVLIFWHIGKFTGINMFGTTSGAGAADFSSSLGKLASTVLQPVLIGMAIRSSPQFNSLLSSKPVKQKLKLTSDLIILSIVYNTFCNTFLSGFGVSGGKVTGLFVVLTVLLIGYKACVFFSANLVGLERKDTIAATFMGSQKTLAFGLPLIKALFGQSPDLVWYCLPILVYHPLQTFLGSALVPKLREWGEGDREGSTSSVNA